MAIGSWDDFTSKYGFSDGETVENRDFRARKRLVRMLNRLPAMKDAQLRAIEYDRPGVHNPCLVIVLPNSEGKRDKQLTEEWLEGKLGSCGLPEAVEDKIYGLADKAYAKAGRR